MPKHRIICVEKALTNGAGQHAHHEHIVAVGTGQDGQCVERRWPLEEVLAAMRAGTTFYTQGPNSNTVTEVESYHCHKCNGFHIRSHPDHVKDNNLDELMRCPVPAPPPRRDKDDRKPQPDRRHG